MGNNRIKKIAAVASKKAAAVAAEAKKVEKVAEESAATVDAIVAVAEKVETPADLAKLAEGNKASEPETKVEVTVSVAEKPLTEDEATIAEVTGASPEAVRKAVAFVEKVVESNEAVPEPVVDEKATVAKIAVTKMPTFNRKVSAEGGKASAISTLRGAAIAMLLEGPTKLSDLVDLGQSWYERRGSFPKSKTYVRVVDLIRLIGSSNGYGLSSEVVDGDVVITIS